MEQYTTELGYTAKEQINGLDIYDDNGDFVCEIRGRYLDSYRKDNGEIDDDLLEAEIKSEVEIEEFLDGQGGWL